MNHISTAPAPGAITGDVRRRILADPEIVLSDPVLMRALVDRSEAPAAGNVVDMRGLAMARLEERLARLEQTHRSVIAAAYENLAGTGQIHRAVLRMLEPADFETFLADLDRHVAPLLRVESIVLAIESRDPDAEPMAPPLRAVPPGFVGRYVTRGRGGPVRQVTLRQMPDGDDGLHAPGACPTLDALGGGALIRGGDDAFGEGDAGGTAVASEACLALDLGEGRLPALLALGCEDPHQFRPGQGTDLLAFFAGAFERALRRWLD